MNTNNHTTISTYSTLISALDINIHGKPERAISIDTTYIPPTLTVYDPRRHYSTYSALLGALG